MTRPRLPRIDPMILAATCTSVVALVRSDTSTKSTNNFLNLSLLRPKSY